MATQLPPELPPDVWPTSHEEHVRAQLRRTAAWSFEQKIDWLEEITRFARELRPVDPDEPQRRKGAKEGGETKN